MSRPLYEVRHLRVAVFDERRAVTDEESGLFSEFDGSELAPGWVEAIPDAGFSVAEGEVLAIVGESGCGKSLTVMGALDLLSAGARTIGGETYLDGRRILPLPRVRRRFARLRRKSKRLRNDDTDWRDIVGKSIGVLFQDPISSWTPIYLIGEQTGEVLAAHSELTEAEITERVLDALGEVRLPKERKFLSFVDELSRGEAQRAMLAAALIKAPRLLIADEPLSGLDAPVAAAILDLIRDLLDKRGMAMVLVTHDLAAVASIADRVAVMYGGRFVEVGSVRDVFHDPTHPYTEGLLGSMPAAGRDRLRPIAGEPPRLVDLPPGCPFAPRCPYAEEECRRERPVLEPIGRSEAACRLKHRLDLHGINR